MIAIDGAPIGAGRTYIIAEAGSNHNGDFDRAKKLIAAAAEARADAIKFQAFKAQQHYSLYTPGFTYLEKQGNKISTFDLIRSLEINRDWHAPLMEYSRSCGIAFLSSPCDREAVDQLAELGMPAFKVASFDLSDIKLISHMAKYNKPMILSTGMASYADIEAAIRACHEVNNRQIILLQCTSLYPAPAELSNLKAMQTMQQAFDCAVGYSDHTLGDHIALAAVAVGAQAIEKHFTLDKTLEGPDHAFAIEPLELRALVAKVRDVENALGDGRKDGPHPLEQEMYEKGRRSLHTRRLLKADEVIREEDICVKRPGYGIAPALYDKIIGMAVKREVCEDHWISWEDLK